MSDLQIAVFAIVGFVVLCIIVGGVAWTSVKAANQKVQEAVIEKRQSEREEVHARGELEASKRTDDERDRDLSALLDDARTRPKDK